jgi:FlaG/FlaF family flagellin (archaellin)
MGSRRWIGQAVLTGVATLTIAGCGGSSGGTQAAQTGSGGGGAFDLGKVESNLAKTARDSGVDEVTCDDVTAEAGATFDCTATGPGGAEGTITVTLSDSEGKSYSYEGEVESSGATTQLSGTVR